MSNAVWMSEVYLSMNSATLRFAFLARLILRVGIGATVCMGGEGSGDLEEQRKKAAAVGRQLFFDTNLSEPRGTSCLSCHTPQAGFADPRPVSPGAVPGRSGHRNAPSLMYVALIQTMVFEDILQASGEELYAWEGGLFQDGRARDLFEQVQGPLFNPNEMNLKDEAVLSNRIRESAYAGAFQEWVGEAAWEDDAKVAYAAYRSLVVFLQSPQFRPFDARIDDFLEGDQSALSEKEKRGLVVFRDKGKCADCHFLEATSWPQPLLSDFGYDNLGVPSRGEIDPGLGVIVKDEEELGKFRAPSLRNVELTAPYMHNGSIGTLREVIEFYNERDVTPERWGATDYPETVNREDFGDLKLSEEEVDDLLALMSAFTDRTLLKMIGEGKSLPEVPGDWEASAEAGLVFPEWTHRYHPEYGTGVAE